VVNDFIPRGYTDSEASCGHVLVTCRRNFPEWQDSCVTLDCFEKHEALQFLYRAVGRSDDEKTDQLLTMAADDDVRDDDVRGWGGGISGNDNDTGVRRRRKRNDTMRVSPDDFEAGRVGVSTGLLRGRAVETVPGWREEEEASAAVLLTERLGRLPLALALAANYMRRCDTSFGEYLGLLDRTSQVSYVTILLVRCSNAKEIT
jgi:hypothetical protein